MKKYNILLSLLFLVTFLARAENKVTLVESYDDDGTPHGINKNWDIKKEGGYVYIMYSQDYSITSQLTLYIDKKNTSGSYIPFDTQFFTYNSDDTKKKFTVYDYKFTEEGDYKITIIGKNSNELANTYTHIGWQEETGNDENKRKAGKDDDAIDTYYYEDSKITFGESIDENAKVSGEATVFYLENGKRDIMVKLQQDKDLKVTKVKVYVYGGTDYKDKISTDTYTIPSLTWNWIKVPVSVNYAGKYVVDMYTQDDTFINSGYFEVKR